MSGVQKKIQSPTKNMCCQKIRSDRDPIGRLTSNHLPPGPTQSTSQAIHSTLFPKPRRHISPTPKTPTAAGGHAPPPPPPPSPTTPSLHPHLHIYPPPSLAFSAPPLPLAPLLSTLPPSGRRDRRPIRQRGGAPRGCAGQAPARSPLRAARGDSGCGKPGGRERAGPQGIQHRAGPVRARRRAGGQRGFREEQRASR